MDKLTGLIMLAVAIQTLVGYYNDFKWEKDITWYKRIPVQKLITAAIGLVVAFGFQLDLIFDLLGLASTLPYLGVILTGFAIGGGPNLLYDIVGKGGKNE